jgi:serine/threonine protein kinase
VQSGSRIGQWTLEDELGRGGNAIVWRARRDDGLDAALKVLQGRRRDSEAFRRFRDEIAILKRLGSHPGILPLIDADLPDEPRAPAWLAMPEAETTRTALDQAPVDLVVGAVATFAETLTDLQRRRIAHRDIKPENLYRYEERWLIGDFGLVEYPEKDSVTRPGQRFGPNHFVAPEVVADAATAEGPPSDLYSLAKTLWVLLTGQRWPPPGEHRLDRPEYLVTTYLSGDRVQLLDPVIARATRHNPAERQTTENFARQLRVWLSPGSNDEPRLPTLSALGERISAYDAKRLERTLVFQDVAPRFNNVFYTLKDHLDRIHRAISNAVPTGLGYGPNPFTARTKTRLASAAHPHGLVHVSAFGRYRSRQPWSPPLLRWDRRRADPR